MVLCGLQGKVVCTEKSQDVQGVQLNLAKRH
jgi:microcompartment protein CcmK/EutM